MIFGEDVTVRQTQNHLPTAPSFSISGGICRTQIFLEMIAEK